MATIDFNEWLTSFEFDDYAEAHGLHQAITNLQTYGQFGVIEQSKPGGAKHHFINHPATPESLLISSSAAQNEFIRLLELEMKKFPR